MDYQRYRPTPAVRASISDDGLVLLDVEGGVVLSSNAIGARIWQLIAEQRTLHDIAEQLASDYGVSVDRAAHDVALFVADLTSRRLIAGETR